MSWMLLLIGFLSALGIYYMIKNRLAIFFPSSKKMIETVLGFADVKKKDIVYDLGSGDGRILFEFGKRGIRTIGIEQNKLLNWLARKKVKDLKNVKIIEGDIFDQDLSEASIIIAYLSRPVTYRLQKKIEREVKKGTKIIIIDHKFKAWGPVKKRTVQMIPIRLYIKEFN